MSTNSLNNSVPRASGHRSCRSGLCSDDFFGRVLMEDFQRARTFLKNDILEKE